MSVKLPKQIEDKLRNIDKLLSSIGDKLTTIDNMFFKLRQAYITSNLSEFENVLFDLSYALLDVSREVHNLIREFDTLSKDVYGKVARKELLNVEKLKTLTSKLGELRWEKLSKVLSTLGSIADRGREVEENFNNRLHKACKRYFESMDVKRVVNYYDLSSDVENACKFVEYLYDKLSKLNDEVSHIGETFLYLEDEVNILQQKLSLIIDAIELQRRRRELLGEVAKLLSEGRVKEALKLVDEYISIEHELEEIRRGKRL